MRPTPSRPSKIGTESVAATSQVTIAPVADPDWAIAGVGDWALGFHELTFDLSPLVAIALLSGLFWWWRARKTAAASGDRSARLSGLICLVAVSLVPLAVNMAIATGANPALFALTVAIATSNSFLIPTHQVNALIMGPGGYRVVDFVRAGGIMTIVFLLVSVFMINAIY